MALEDEDVKRKIRDGIIKEKFYVCGYCEAITESYTLVDKCESCGRNNEHFEASTLENAKKIVDVNKQKRMPKPKEPIKNRFEIANEILETAKNYLKYGAKKEARHELAKWLCEHRSVITDAITEKTYAYDEYEGHYNKAGELLLKADLNMAIDFECTNNITAEVIAKVKAMSYREPKYLEELRPKELLPFTNGIYDITKPELHRKHGLSPHTPAWFFTYKHPVTYDPMAECPEINKFLQDIVPNEYEREILIDIAALCLYRGRVTRKFFILTGSGHNGKSKYLDIIKAIVGEERCVSVTPQHLAENDFAGSLLYDKHVNLGADIPGGKIEDASILKGVTGGDSITVQKKGKDHFDIKPYCELIYSSNDPPRFNEDTYALWDRLVIISFPYTFTDDPKGPNEKRADKDIEKKILTPKELSGFLNILLERLPRLVDNKKLSVVIDPANIKKDYQTITNSPQAFLNECCQMTDYEPGSNLQQATGWVSKPELYNAYSKWCKEKKLRVQSHNMFTRLIMAVPGWSIEEGRESINGEYQDYKSRIESYRGVSLLSRFSPILFYTLKSVEQNREIRAPRATDVYKETKTSNDLPKIFKQDVWKDWLDEQPGGTVPVELFIAYITEHCPGLMYDNLKMKGEIYEPKPDMVRRVL